jgi:hypothetical protein
MKVSQFSQRVDSRRDRASAAVFAPLWTRWLVLAFTLLFGAVTTAQAAHLHRPAKPGHHLQAPTVASPTADNEEHCPLCVAAMHAAMPVPSPVPLAPGLRDATFEGQPAHVKVETAWHFARFGRPPPAQG